MLIFYLLTHSSPARRVSDLSDRIGPYWPYLHPSVPLWRESGLRISAAVPAQPLGDSVDVDHFLLSALYVLHSGLAPRQFVIAYDHGKLRTACIGPLHAFLHIAAKAHVAGDSCTAEVREQACRRFFGRRAHGDQDNMGFFFLWGINKHREPLDPRRPANARRFRDRKSTEERRKGEGCVRTGKYRGG